jgi:FMN phosphatase YigB (HAD superfamily)
MEKHTPGPWECGKFAHYFTDVVAVDGRRVATATIAYRSSAEADANARLLAAAPDLLAALRTARERIVSLSDATGSVSRRTLADIDAAIAKAEASR